MHLFKKIVLVAGVFLMGNCFVMGQIQKEGEPKEGEKKQKSRSMKVKLEREYTEAEYRKLLGKSTEPTKAALLSVIFPGAGQIYNKKYWKIPIFYTGLTVLGLITSTNHKEFIEARNNLAYITDADPANNVLIDERYAGLEAQNFVDRRDRFRRDRDYYMILTILWYAVGVADAAVDAHLQQFNVTEDLSLRIKPDLLPMSYAVTQGSNAIAPGVTLTFQIR